MDKTWYQANGFKLSSFVEDGDITRAEADVTAAYITPIVGDATVDEDVLQKTTAALAFLLLLQRGIFATRAGAKTKMGYNSQDADAWAILQQEATSCHLALQTLREQEGVDADAEVTDICKIYFKTNFFTL